MKITSNLTLKTNEGKNMPVLEKLWSLYIRNEKKLTDRDQRYILGLINATNWCMESDNFDESVGNILLEIYEALLVSGSLSDEERWDCLEKYRGQSIKLFGE